MEVLKLDVTLFGVFKALFSLLSAPIFSHSKSTQSAPLNNKILCLHNDRTPLNKFADFRQQFKYSKIKMIALNPPIDCREFHVGSKIHAKLFKIKKSRRVVAQKTVSTKVRQVFESSSIDKSSRGIKPSSVPSKTATVQDEATYYEMNDSRITKEFTLLRLLTSSGQASISIVQSTKDKQAYALKTFRKSMTDDGFKAEVEALESAGRHHRIMGYRGFMPNISRARYRTVLLDYYAGGDLMDVLRRSCAAKQQLPEALIWHIFRQMAEAVAWIHSGMSSLSKDKLTMIHRDIKLDNWLVDLSQLNETGMPNLRLADFGLAFIAPAAKFEKWLSQQPAEWAGTPELLPPEGVDFYQGHGKECRNTKAADVWAVGSCMQKLATYRSSTGDPPDSFHSWDQERQEEWFMTSPRVIRSLSCESETWYTNLELSGWKSVRLYSEALDRATAHAMRVLERRPTALQLVDDVDVLAAQGETNDCRICPAWVYGS
jgi:hypothetical protein